MSCFDFTKGNIRAQLVRFSIPFFLTSLIQSLYNIADIKVVGDFCGNPGIAATSIAGNLTWSLTYGIIALCNGSGHTLFTMIPSIVSSVIARVPVAWFCVRVLDLKILGVGISTPTGTLSAIIICAWYYYSDRWTKSTL